MTSLARSISWSRLRRVAGGWYANLRADPRASVLVAGKRRRVEARLASGGEADEPWRRFEDQFAQIRNTRRVTRRDVPVVVPEPTA